MRIPFSETTAKFFLVIALLATFIQGTLHRNGSFRSEVSLWRDAVRKAPAKERARYNLGTALKDTGDLESAKQEWLRALELNPKNSQTLNQLGTIYYLARNYALAEEYYLRSLQADPYNIEANYNQAMTLEILGDARGAVRYYDTVRKQATGEYAYLVPVVSDKIRSLQAGHK